jgi:hypothetical protein
MLCRRSLQVLAAAVCGAFSPVWAQGTTAPASFTRTNVFAPVGLAASETASITVVNTATAASPSSANAVLAPSCAGTISFFNANGEIGTPLPFTVGSGQFVTVTLAFSEAGLPGNRGEIRGSISLTASTSTPSPCSLLASMETYDSSTGATHAVLSTSMATLTPVVPVGPIVPLAAR